MARPAGLTHIGQGIPGGAAGLPGTVASPAPSVSGLPAGIAGIPRLSSSLHAPAFPSIAATSVRSLTPRPTGTIVPSAHAIDLASALEILRKVRDREMDWKDAQQLLADIPDAERAALASNASSVIGGHLDFDVARSLAKTLEKPGTRHATPAGALGNLAGDVSSTIKGMPAGVYLAGKAVASDVAGSIEHPLQPRGLITGRENSQIFQKVLKPAGQSLADTYGPLAHGDVKGFARKVYAHPLGPILDALTVASVGIGATARATAAARAIEATKITRGAKGEAVIGEAGPGVTLKIRRMKGGLYDIRDAKGRVVRTRFPTEDAAIAHAQSLVTGGVAVKPLEQSILEVYKPAKGERGFEKIARENKFRVTFHEPTTFTRDKALALDKEISAWNQGEISGTRVQPFSPEVRQEMLDQGYPEQLIRDMETQTIPTPQVIAEHALGSAIPPTEGTFAGQHAFQDHLIEVRDPKGNLSAVGSFAPGTGVADRSLEIGYVGAKDPGSGVALLQNLARKYPDHDFYFEAATDQVAKYYRDMGAEEIDRGTFRINSEDVAKIAQGQAVVKGSTHQYKVQGANLTPKSKLGIGLEAAVSKGARGNLIHAYERARNITHEDEHLVLMEEFAKVIDDPGLRLNRRSLKQIAADIVAETKTTAAKDVSRMRESKNPMFVPESRAMHGVGLVLREASDLVRAGAVYLRPAYLPNNWAGNEFMNIAQQGVFAPVNLGKSLVLSKYLTVQERRALQAMMGRNAAQAVLAPKGQGYVSSATRPLAEVMGDIADNPFREAAMLHELRKAGYPKLSDVQRLVRQATAHNTPNGQSALRILAKSARDASEEIVKFGHMNDIERSVLRNLVFVYSWIRGAGRYTGRFPMAHPIQAAVLAEQAQQGNKWLQSEMGGVPSFLVGAIPVGHDDKGNPILINPFSLNPLGTGLQIAQAAAGAYKVFQNPNEFDKYTQQDLVSLLNPLAQSYIEAREGGKSVPEQLKQTFAPYRLARGLQHPGSGSVYPTTRAEAVGKFTVGSLYPTKADQAAITRALERENSAHPEALIPEQIKLFKKATGQDVPKELVDLYKKDLQAIDQQRKFQLDYAHSKGSTGFSKMSPANRAEAALSYLSQYHLVAPQELAMLRDAVAQATNDTSLNDIANGLWSISGTGSIKRNWDDLMRSARGRGLSRKKP